MNQLDDLLNELILNPKGDLGSTPNISTSMLALNLHKEPEKAPELLDLDNLLGELVTKGDVAQQTKNNLDAKECEQITAVPQNQSEVLRTNNNNNYLAEPINSSTNASVIATPNTPVDNSIQALNTSANAISAIPVNNSTSVCGSCNQPVFQNSPSIAALNRIWHSNHFVCTVCNTNLSNSRYCEKNDLLYCLKDYSNLFAPKCGYCHLPILEKAISAVGNTWHPNHFFCSQCGDSFADGTFMEFDGKAYCESDYRQMFMPKCKKCGKCVQDECVNAIGCQWHPSCFTCQECNCSFADGNFYEFEEKPLCEFHYYMKKKLMCHSCQNPIKGKCMTTSSGKRFHPEHFCCSYCLKKLNITDFKEKNDKSYCTDCFRKLHG